MVLAYLHSYEILLLSYALTRILQNFIIPKVSPIKKHISSKNQLSDKESISSSNTSSLPPPPPLPLTKPPKRKIRNNNKWKKMTTSSSYAIE